MRPKTATVNIDFLAFEVTPCGDSQKITLQSAGTTSVLQNSVDVDFY